MFPPKWLTDEKQLWRALEPLLTFPVALLVRAANQTERGRIRSEIRLRLLRRFRAAGVPLPNPELARTLSTDADRD